MLCLQARQSTPQLLCCISSCWFCNTTYVSTYVFLGRPAPILLSRDLPCKQQYIIWVQWPLIFQCLGKSTVQQFQKSKSSSTITSTFYTGSLFCRLPHFSCCQNSESQDVTLCLSIFPPLSIFIFYLPRSPSWLAFNNCLTIFGIWLLAGVHTSLFSWAQVPHSCTFYFHPIPDHLLLEGDTRVRWTYLSRIQVSSLVPSGSPVNVNKLLKEESPLKIWLN